MDILHRFAPRTDFWDYEDFKSHFTIQIPDRFDFARDVVDVWAQEEPEKQALLYCTDEGDERSFCFREISALSKQAATWFLQNGVSKGDRVMTLLRRRWEYWIIAVALCRIGAVAVPSSIQMTRKDIAYRLKASGAKWLLALNDAFVLEQIAGLEEQLDGPFRIATAGDQPVEGYPWFTQEMQSCQPFEGKAGAGNQDEMIVYFTSGTSGYPKMAIHNRIYPLGHIVTARYMQCVQNNGLHLTQSDSGWAKFGWGNIYGQWICGTAILAYDPIRFHAENMLRILERYQPTTICVPPTMYRFLLQGGLSQEHVRGTQWFSTAGEPLSGEVNSRFHQLTGHFIHEGFGQSESTPITCGFSWLPIKPSSMGKPSPLYDVAIIDSKGNRCPMGVVGEIAIFVPDKSRQLGLLDCYYADGIKIDPVVDGIYHTGDTAYMDEDGYYWYVGRADDMIKSSGYRIGPFEIESVLNTHPTVKESAIVGAPDPIRGQIVCAVVSLREPYQPSDTLTKELQTYIKTNTAPYKYPRKIVYVEELPHTSSGKIIRRLAKQLVS